MNPELRGRIAALAPLDEAHAQANIATCKLCGRPAPLFDVVDLQKHCAFDNPYKFGLSGLQVPYARCGSCGFMFTTFFDSWEDSDWRRFIYNDDYIKVDPDYSGARAIRVADLMARTLDGCQHLRILDYGAGSGVFVDSMRQAGFTRIEGYDPYSSPVRPAGSFDVVTCLEVLEHTPDPRAAIADIQALLAPDGSLIFSQSIQPGNITDIRGAWWYVAPRNGHISMFTVDALTRLRPSPAYRLYGQDPYWAIVPREVNQAMAPALRRIGPVVQSHRLTAPVCGLEDQFHAPEHASAGDFRWSRRAKLKWLVPAPTTYPARLHVEIPFALEISQGFAAGCTVSVQGIEAAMQCGQSRMTALLQLDRAQPGMADTLSVTLQTPAPRSPFDVRGAPDERALGLAILTA